MSPELDGPTRCRPTRRERTRRDDPTDRRVTNSIAIDQSDAARRTTTRRPVGSTDRDRGQPMSRTRAGRRPGPDRGHRPEDRRRAGRRRHPDVPAARRPRDDEPRSRPRSTTAGIRFAPSLVTWAEQAQLLADGDEAGVPGTDRPADRRARRLEDREGRRRAAARRRTICARIEGIGPKIAGALVAAGIPYVPRSSPTPTSATLHEGDQAMPASRSRRASSTWAEQARLLADGDEDAFAVLTARLIAGRRADDNLGAYRGYRAQDGRRPGSSPESAPTNNSPSPEQGVLREAIESDPA